MKIIRARDYQHLSRQAANILSAQVILKPDSVLGLATGSSPIGTYQQLIAWEHKGDVDFRQVSTVNLDEYVGLPAGHPQSYAHFMRENFFDHIQIDLRNTQHSEWHGRGRRRGVPPLRRDHPPAGRH